ncbi:MAG TPA: hypothetical protein VM935_17200, partial [Chitinophagaceae bacterium]|nr:hypothetical protein [Chitinophagaceae bacterium]
NVVNRGMGGISAAYSDAFSINFNNPASYSSFKTYVEEKSGRATSGRVLLDIGVNYESKTLRAPNNPLKFSSSYGYFSYIQVGLPLNKNWGLSFGLRPVSRINYKINQVGVVTDPLTNKDIDSALTQFNGNGGMNLPTIGTGYAIKNFSIGGSIGYLFGKREFSTRRIFLSNSVPFQSSNYATNSYVGDLFFNAGAQYKITINKETLLRLGFSGNLQQNLKANRSTVRETFITDANGSNVRVDSALEVNEEKGELIYPASYTTGFVLEHQKEKGGSWLIGVDYVTTKWDNYRYFNSKDAVRNNWQIRAGAQIRPKPASNYFSNVAYRLGFYTGPDYINVGTELPQSGISLGLALPVANYNRLSPGQFTIVNLGFEYGRRGNNDNTLKENQFRISAGLNLSDLWFSKRRYD